MECKFQVGQKVECIYAGRWKSAVDGSVRPDGPREGQVLRITEIRTTSRYVGLTFAEFEPRCFLHTCFRPLSERPTDISELEKLLITPRETVTA